MDDYFIKVQQQKSLHLMVESPATSANCRFKGKCSLGAFSYVGAGSAVSNTDIGRYCSIATGVQISPTSHPTDRFTTHLIAFANKGPFGESAEFNRIVGGPRLNNGKLPRTVVGHDVWIGANSIIKRGLSIGHGAIVGAGAVVTRDVAPYEIVGGVAAKRIRSRFDEETVNRLSALEWWLYDLSRCGLADAEREHVQRFLDRMETLKANGALCRLSPHTLLFKDDASEPVQPIYP
ncbi:CatB-related O-acetyltransferase [Shinella sp.]|uniref:CatB-related O-acetyltransferase n=1 Tax=Shinella sp. TaxID=1870904 RepID=UPI0029B225BF|nr:CatB-related O-acetyltransferase [Shinella sp.]MDX3973484.1 CatB-related O-acetyltransferase [Shinella sp.]